MKAFLGAVLGLLLISSPLYSRDYNILDFGAVAGKKGNNTKAIQEAINQAEKEGGGRVVVPKGTFVTGSIVLKSGVELHLMKNAILLGSLKINDYRLSQRDWKALIMADGAKNISISGKGEIDGRGTAIALHLDSLFYAGKIDSSQYNLKDKRPRVTIRPQLIEFLFCQNASISGVSLRNAAGWVQSYVHCEGLIIDKIKVDSDAYWNNDGIDIIDCKQVRITNSTINASDDGICLKSYNWPKGHSSNCEGIYIANCTVRSSASAIKLGTANYGGFKNVVVQNIKIYDTYRSAIALESWQRGGLENVEISNIKARNTGNALFIRLGKYHKDDRVGSIRNVSIKKMKVTVPFERADKNYRYRGPALPFFHNTFPSSITGLPGHPVKDIVIEDLEITCPGRAEKGYANAPLNRLNDVPLKADQYPEFSMFGELPAWGLYVRHVEGLQLKSVKMKVKKPDYRPGFVFDSVKDLTLKNVEIQGDRKKEDFIYHKLKGWKVIEDTATYLDD